MSWNLRVSSEAEQCIDEQMQWYEIDEKHGGAELANRWLGKLEAALMKLSEHPERHGFAPENGRWHQGLDIRQMRFRPWKTKPGWRVLYVLDERLHTLTVLQVRHERRQWLFVDE